MSSIRQDMVKRAVIFLRHPKVKDAPLAKQVAFLKHKSLTNEEISDAITQAAAAATSKTPALPAPTPHASAVKRLRPGPLRSEAVVAGGMVFISGQTGFPPEKVQRTAGSGDAHNPEGVAELEKGGRDAEAQATKALEKVKGLLEEAGSSVSKVVAVTFYIKDMAEDLKGIDAAWGRWIDRDTAPARTVVQTGGGVVGGEVGGQEVLRVEVQATAHL